MKRTVLRGSILGAALVFFCFQLFSVQAGASGIAETGGGVPAGYLALTFDDGPTAGATEYLLDGLRERGVPATFFLCGYRIELYPSLVSTIAADGHELAVHGFTHAYLNTMEQAEIDKELAGTAELIAELSGVRVHTFRPPGGLYSEATLAAAEANGLSVVLWNVDPEDWRDHDAAVIAQRILAKARSGDVVLLHDLYRTSADAAFRVIDTLQARGWQFVTVSELADLNGQTLTPGQILALAP